jgi:hypothetical protein
MVLRVQVMVCDPWSGFILKGSNSWGATRVMGAGDQLVIVSDM